MALVDGITVGLCIIFVIVTVITGDLDTSGSFRFEPFAFGPPQSLNSSRFPSCSVDPETGYVCCDKRLREIILSTMKGLNEVGSGVSKGLGYSKCNLHNMASIMQRRSEHELGNPIEAIISVGKLADKVHVLDNMHCKMRVEGKSILLYAAETAIPTTTTTTTTTTTSTSTTTDTTIATEPEPLRQGCGEIKKKV